MSENHSIDRRKMLGTTVAFAATASVLPVSVKAQNVNAAVDAFYQSGEFTYCDIKMLANYWGNSRFDAKVLGGQKILAGGYNVLRSVLKNAVAEGQKKGMRCQFSDADNPAYTYNDAVALSKYWTKAWGNKMTPYDAKLKIALNIENGGNLWVRGELAKARR